MTDLKERCWVGGVQPVVGTGRVRWKTIGDADGVGDPASDVGDDIPSGEGDGVGAEELDV